MNFDNDNNNQKLSETWGNKIRDFITNTTNKYHMIFTDSIMT